MSHQKVKDIINEKAGPNGRTEFLRRMAGRCGVNISTLYRHLRVPQEAKASQLQRYAEYLEIPVEMFMGQDEAQPTT